MSALAVPSRRTAVVVSLSCAAVVVVLGLLVRADWSPLQRFDAAIDEALHPWAVATPWAVEVAKVLDTIGQFAVSFWVTTSIVVLLLLLRRWRLALGVAGVAILAPLVTDWIKVVVARPRPVWVDPLWAEGTWSYPSGHATAGIAVYAVGGIAVASLLRDRRWALAVAVASTVLGLTIGLSRLVLGVHWPSDVVGGWCVAVAVAAAFLALLRPPVRGSGVDGVGARDDLVGERADADRGDRPEQ